MDEQDKSNNKIKGFFSKIGKDIKGFGEKVIDKIEDAKDKKELEKSLEDLFNSDAMQFTLVIPNEKRNKLLKCMAKIDYDNSIITIYGDRNDLTQECFFIDKLNQKFKIKLIRLNQKIMLSLNGENYERSATKIEYTIQNDEITKNEMKTIINNNQINISDSTINKSNIG